MHTYHPKAPRRYNINFGNENLILSSLFFIVIKHALTKNLKKDDVLVIGPVTSSVEIFMPHFCGGFSQTACLVFVWGLDFYVDETVIIICNKQALSVCKIMKMLNHTRFLHLEQTQYARQTLTARHCKIMYDKMDSSHTPSPSPKSNHTAEKIRTFLVKTLFH